VYFIVRAGNGVFAIATLAIFSQHLSTADYGVYALGIAIATVASGVLYQWLNVAVGRFYPAQRDELEKIKVVTALGYWFTTVVAAVLFIGVFQFREIFDVDPVLIGILFLISVVQARHNLALQMANSEGRPFRYGLISWSKGCGALLTGLALINYGIGEKGALLGLLVGLLFSVLAFAPQPLLIIRFHSLDKQLAENMFRFGLPFAFNHLAIAFVDVADRFMIGSLLGVAYVAPYALAYDLVQLSIGPTMNVLFLAAFPLIVRMFEVAQDDEARIRLHEFGSRLIILGLPVTVGVGFFASDISDILFRSDYRQDATMIMPWLAAAIFVGAIKSYFLDVVFQLRNKTKYLGYIAISMAVVNIALNLILLPQYGVIGAAWATLVAFTTGALASWAVGKSFLSLPSLCSVFCRSVIACAFMIVVLYLLPPSSGLMWLFTKFAVGFITYVLMTWVLDLAGCLRLFKS
jgi:O-antigen/teichoic acid export membrane protein